MSRRTGRLLRPLRRRAARLRRALTQPSLTVPDGSPIRPLTEAEFQQLVAQHRYYRGRWGYTSRALGQAARLIRRDGLRTALEMGAPIRPVVVGADVMDITARPGLDPTATFIRHDATVAPWPVADKSYDLFVALQVFEHLGDRQREAFLEVRRVARNAIISLPIDWEMAKPSDIHHQISQERVLSWFAPVRPTRVVTGNSGPRKRLIFVFEDLPLPASPASGPEGPIPRP